MLATLFTILGTAFFGVFGWIVQKVAGFNTRIVVLETRRADLTDLINSKFDTVEAKLDGQASRLERIERVMNGYLRHGD